MKKNFAMIVMAAIVSVAFVACGGAKEEAPAAEEAPVAEAPAAEEAAAPADSAVVAADSTVVEAPVAE